MVYLYINANISMMNFFKKQQPQEKQEFANLLDVRNFVTLIVMLCLVLIVGSFYSILKAEIEYQIIDLGPIGSGWRAFTWAF